MSVRSQRNMREKFGIDSRGEPSYMRQTARLSRASIGRQWFNMRSYRNFQVINTVAMSEVTFARNSIATNLDPVGNISNVPVHRDRWRQQSVGARQVPMLWTEKTTTNFLLNSTAPATQTTGSLATGTYALWVVGSGTATVAAGTGSATGLGAATASTPIIFTVTVAGTFTVTVAGSLTRFQLEDSLFPTSFIPTAGATVQRVRDDWLWTPTARGSGLFGAGNTISFAFMIPQAVSASDLNRFVFNISDGTTNNRINLQLVAATAVLRITPIAATVTGTIQNTSAISPNTLYGVALAWDSSGYSLAMNGALVGSQTTACPTTALTQITPGGGAVAGITAMCGFTTMGVKLPTRVSTARLAELSRVDMF